jgi:hypothetical protein
MKGRWGVGLAHEEGGAAAEAERVEDVEGDVGVGGEVKAVAAVLGIGGDELGERVC